MTSEITVVDVELELLWVNDHMKNSVRKEFPEVGSSREKITGLIAKAETWTE